MPSTSGIRKRLFSDPDSSKKIKVTKYHDTIDMEGISGLYRFSRD